MTDQKWKNKNNNSKITELATSLIITNQITFVYAATRRDRLVQHLHTAHPGRSYKKIINNSRWLSCVALTHTHTRTQVNTHRHTHAHKENATGGSKLCFLFQELQLLQVNAVLYSLTRNKWHFTCIIACI